MFRVAGEKNFYNICHLVPYWLREREEREGESRGGRGRERENHIKQNTFIKKWRGTRVTTNLVC